MVSHVRKANPTTAKITPQIICGIEIELEYNVTAVGGFPVGNYHSSNPTWFTPNFAAERDGSLSRQTFLSGATAEFVSRPFLIKDYKNILTEFKNGFEARMRTRPRNYQMSDIISFNRSTGAHIHLSIVNQKKGIKSRYTIVDRDKIFELNNSKGVWLKAINDKTLYAINRAIIRRVKKELPQVYSKFRRRFYRDYALQQIDRTGRNRYCTWNFDTDGSDHIEFRSFHLYGITTWDEFFKMYQIAFETIEEKFSKAIKYRFRNEDKVAYVDVMAGQKNEDTNLFLGSVNPDLEVVRDRTYTIEIVDTPTEIVLNRRER